MTSATIKIHRDGKRTRPVAVIYQHNDGYFDELGKTLQKFLRDMVVVNGISIYTPKKAANGMGCLAAQLIVHLKKGIGNIYLCEGCDQSQYKYDIYLNKNGHLVLEGKHNIGYVTDSKQFDLSNEE